VDHGDQTDPDEIRRRMAALRNQLEGDVQGVSESARAMSDWRFYVRRFPFAAAGVAAAAGFLLVPRKSEVIVPDADTLAALAKANQVWVKTGAPHASDQPRGLLGGLVALAVTGATRLAMTWASQQLKRSFAAAADRRADHEAPTEAEEESESPLPYGHRFPPR
jgi:hypothetical protein